MEELKNYNIKIVEGNDFALLVPFKARTFVACRPIDEDIDVLALTDVVAKFGGVVYPTELTEAGVLVKIPAGPKPGDYTLEVTADYYGVSVRAAYNRAVTIVAYNGQSSAQQYLQGSPVVLPAAYFLAVLTDAELDQLKADLRQKIADAEQAKADAEAAKEHYDQLAEQLTGVAQEQTLTDGVAAIREDISHIDIDTTTLAKEATAEAAKQAALDAKAAAQGITGYALQGSDATATNTALAQLIGYTIDEIDGV